MLSEAGSEHHSTLYLLSSLALQSITHRIHFAIRFGTFMAVLRSSNALPENFEFPDIRGNRVVVPPNEDQAEAPAEAPTINETQADPQVIMAATSESFVENPNQGDFNPGTKVGRDTFEKKTKGLEESKRLEMSKKYAPTLRRLLDSKASDFGKTVTNVPTSFDAHGTVIATANLLKDYSKITLERLQREAFKRFGTSIAEGTALPAAPFRYRALVSPETDAAEKGIFYSRVHANVVSEWIKNILTPEAYATLLRQKTKFAFANSATGEESLDGPTMLFILLGKIDPSVIVGAEACRSELERLKLHDFENDVNKITDRIEELYSEIERLGSTCESIRRYTITALKSGPNDQFNSYIDRINDDIEAGSGQYRDLEWSDIIKSARSKYNNMLTTKEWTKVDPRDAKLMALTSKLEALVKGDSAKPQTAQPQRTPGAGDTSGGVDRWRTVKGAASMVKDGKTWHWCPHHVHPHGHFNGLYVLHKPENHEEWKANRRRGKRDTAAVTAGTSDPTPAPAAENSDSKLTISARLKEALCTQLMLSDADADAFCSQLEQGN